jgi:hypothetical protein
MTNHICLIDSDDGDEPSGKKATREPLSEARTNGSPSSQETIHRIVLANAWWPWKSHLESICTLQSLHAYWSVEWNGMEWISEMAADGGRVAEPVKLFLSRAWDSNIQNRPVQPCRRKQIRKYSTSHLSSFSCPIGRHSYYTSEDAVRNDKLTSV